MYLFGTSLLCYIAFIIMFSIELLKLIIKNEQTMGSLLIFYFSFVCFIY